MNTSHIADVGDSVHLDIFDPRNWDSLDSKQIDILAQEGSERGTSFKKSHNDKYLGCFLHYSTITLESEVSEKIDCKDIIEDFISKNTKRIL